MQMVQKHRCCQIADHPGCEKSSRMLLSVAQKGSRVIQKEARGEEGCYHFTNCCGKVSLDPFQLLGAVHLICVALAVY